MYDERRDIPRERRSEVREAAVSAAQAAAPDVDGLSVIVYDDRERALAEGRRDLVSGAAATAQKLLKAADRLMTMAGNGTWNSANGFDRVAFRALQDAEEELLAALPRILELRSKTMAYVERGGWADAAGAQQRAEEQRV